MTIRATILDKVAKSYSLSAHESFDCAGRAAVESMDAREHTLMLSRVFRDHSIASLRNIATASVQTGSS